ncbi:MAG: ATP-binding protein [Alphaproteobacteria bacterium]|nr:ATP-binding protein [Alphaproteobacteria bacterium]MCW5739494.1 ATP-binding protein [Alphaproteobacteria bacterium]
MILHLICGSTGAGKTTYALELCRQTGAVHFSIDEWMVSLYGPDAPQPPDWGWISTRVRRCEDLIAILALQTAGRGVPAVLDLSFLRAADRKRFADKAREAGVPVKLHHVDVAADERWRRVQERNDRKGETYRLAVTRFMFDGIESIWQPPGTDEMAALDGVRV